MLTSTPITPDLVRGALELEPTEQGLRPHRFPASARAQADGQLAMAEAQPSGVRLVFRTKATVIELDTIRTTVTYVGLPGRPDGIYDLVVDGRLARQATGSAGHVLEIDMATGEADFRAGQAGTVRFEGLADTAKDVEIWLPWNEATELVALRTDAPAEPLPDNGRRVWLHHGSSISHGSNAASPTTTWPAVAAVGGGVKLVNLGVGGSALVDPYTARVIRDARADLISVKLGINVVNHDAMRLRVFGPAVHGFIDTIREGHPETPLLVVSPICCPIHEDTPGPSAPSFDENGIHFAAGGDPADVRAGKLTLSVIRDELARIVQARAKDDPNLYYLDGLELYGPDDYAENPLPDELHPDAATQRLIGRRFAARAFGAAGPFSIYSP
ncbi:GDSL-type esterase/lipase family protein [Nocardioides caricicola]|uniref:GDSL-type esterase/lipase family protein n=1 Tax=Nocardioides caricicola TaxID=634770 RepID=A0ABW0N2M8_9ACTN